MGIFFFFWEAFEWFPGFSCATLLVIIHYYVIEEDRNFLMSSVQWRGSFRVTIHGLKPCFP